MRIALVTIHNSTNYGAVLQAYATQRVLSKYGSVVVIDYDNRFLARQMRLIRFDASFHGLLKLAHDILRIPSRVRLLRKFYAFFKSKLLLSSKLRGVSLYNGDAGFFDVYVCGSDQIWNPLVISESGEIDEIYFLDFAPEGSKKISYASSIGHHKFLKSEETKKISTLLHDFTAISLRESDGVEMIANILPRKDVRHVLDPTLLLDAREWLDLMKCDYKVPSGKYILVYTVPRSSLMVSAINYYRENLGLKVVGIDPMLRPIADFDLHLKDVGPEEFVNLFSGAEFIITDSFHGACFSINFGKPFVLVSPGVRSNRMASLFNVLHLNHRLVTTESDFPKINFSNDDLNLANLKLMESRNDSLAFLDSSLVK